MLCGKCRVKATFIWAEPTCGTLLLVLGCHGPFTAEFVLRGWQPSLEDERLLREDIYVSPPPGYTAVHPDLAHITCAS
eukprot:COSAG01_NODE_9939_length_2296_cov_6.528448_3_plen_78_part_00